MSYVINSKVLRELKEAHKKSTQVVGWYEHGWEDGTIRGPFHRWFKCAEVLEQWKHHVACVADDVKFATLAMNYTAPLVETVEELVKYLRIIQNGVDGGWAKPIEKKLKEMGFEDGDSGYCNFSMAGIEFMEENRVFSYMLEGLWTYVGDSIRKNTNYSILSKTKIKIGDGEWVDGVVYSDLITGKVYCRDVKTFLEKFKKQEIKGD